MRKFLPYFLIATMGCQLVRSEPEKPREFYVDKESKKIEYGNITAGYTCTFDNDSSFTLNDIVAVNYWSPTQPTSPTYSVSRAEESFRNWLENHGDECLQLHSTIERLLKQKGVRSFEGSLVFTAR